MFKEWVMGVFLQHYCTKVIAFTCKRCQQPLCPVFIAAPHGQLLPLFPCPHQSVVVTQQFYRAMPVPSVVVPQFYRAMPVPSVVVTQQFYRAMPVPSVVVT